jgi:V/A-type H+-transporting ATPase subunit I
MSLRPVAAKWFEVLVVRDDLTAALDVLARSSRVELQSHGESRAPLLDRRARELLDEFSALDRRYAHYWPAPSAHETDERREPFAMLENAMARLRSWSAAAVDVVDRLETLRHQRADLQLLHDLLAAGAGRLPDLEALTSAGPLLTTRLYLLADDKWPPGLPAAIIAQRLAAEGKTFLLAVGLPDECAELDGQMHLQKARPVTIPPSLPGQPSAAAALIGQQLADQAAAIDAADAELVRCSEEHDIADAIADAEFVRWYVDSVPELSSTENFAWITGWTSDPDEESLLRLLADAGIKGLLHVSDPPPGFEAPLLLRNPKWVQPFEFFTRMLGVPAAGEADPTRIVAVASPLMFGFMFGDVGHGIVVLAAGLVLSRRIPALRLLIAGGALSIVFGFLFGSVFALESLIEPLWVRPMDEPILMFIVPMAGGAVLLLTGMTLDALQAFWQHRARAWWGAVAGLVLCYLALLGALLEPRLLWLALAGAAWFVFGHALAADGQRLAALGSAAGELLESLLQLVVNTVSFVRVGAFALAHAGLSIAVVGLAEAPASVVASIVVLILGNALIIGLEGLVVSIQTTRLVLFEFFVRFLRAEGRPFKPLAPAPPVARGRYRRP